MATPAVGYANDALCHWVPKPRRRLRTTAVPSKVVSELKCLFEDGNYRPDCPDDWHLVAGICQVLKYMLHLIITPMEFVAIAFKGRILGFPGQQGRGAAAIFFVDLTQQTLMIRLGETGDWPSVPLLNGEKSSAANLQCEFRWWTYL